MAARPGSASTRSRKTAESFLSGLERAVARHRCNLACKFCQNWDISKSREMDTLMTLPPEAIARIAASATARVSPTPTTTP
jgi:uncharacterized Fe-S radical SAM superfamily protein PflX